MVPNPRIRLLITVVLAALAGMSLCLGILPLTLSKAGIGDETVLLKLLSQFTLYVMLIWAVGGWAVFRLAFPLGSGLILGLTGLASGIFLVLVALHPAAKILAVAGVSGLVYGFLGGLMISRLAAAPSVEEEEPS